MIEVHGLTKLYGRRAAVRDLGFTVRPGIVTGFLGPNGAGKSTTMRLILGLDAPTAGDARVNGRRYVEHRAPLREVGAFLDARAVHAGRSARNHLLALAATHTIGAGRVDEVLDLVGLGDVAGNRVGTFSLGMGQRLGIAAALLGDPSTVILDEPINGLDPEGVRWVRNLLKALAAEGRTVFLSSHVMSELALTAQHVIVIGKGRSSRTSMSPNCWPARRRPRCGSAHRTRLRSAACWPDPTSRSPRSRRAYWWSGDSIPRGSAPWCAPIAWNSTS
jgi:ABC-2 type transport system ATP-binding protein